MNELPTLHEATLDDETLQALFADVQQLTADVEVFEKRQARQLVPAEPLSLAVGLDLLRTRRARAIQLRYDFDGQRWCDTLTPCDGGYRLARISLSAAACS